MEYFTFNIEKPKGTVTIMKYEDGKITLHRKNELFWDIHEIEMEIDHLKALLWENRKMINRYFKNNNEKAS